VNANIQKNYRNNLNENSQLMSLLNSEIRTKKNDIHTLYLSIIEIVQAISEKCTPKPKFKPYIKPYWNNELSRLHIEMVYKRQLWISENRSRDINCPSFIAYKTAKRVF
jgi:hypothetical protein